MSTFGKVGEGADKRFPCVSGLLFVIGQGNFITVCIMDYDCQT